MIRPLAGPPTWRHLAASLALVLLISVGWYGMQPVYPDCVLFSTGRPSAESLRRAHQQAIESGQCDPSYPRWTTWTG
ncbi:hypothetical protein [Streptomyces sp. NPDC091268]|uniref:hypothetical protein n=1 Tax=Streptomyces sp. NPDC091268 TaxID=3365979 RepID=UPI003810244C